MITAAVVAAGAVIGAPLRYLTDRAVQQRHDSAFPWGTLSVNIVASLLLGLVAGAASAGAVSSTALALIGTGFCATLSTYSTYSYETWRLIEEGEWFHVVANVAVSVLAGVGAASIGWTIGIGLH
jgi:CrcB protein